MKQVSWSILAIAVLLLGACSGSRENAEPVKAANTSAGKAEAKNVERLKKQRDAVVPFFKLMGKPRPGDWLQNFPEKGQTFEEYMASAPTLPTEDRRTIYIQPIGEFNSEQKKILELTAEYMRAFYGLPVVMKPVRSLGKVPADKQRKAFYSNDLQIKTSYFLEDLLPTMISKDAAGLICLTNVDLYPGDTQMAYVFGQANLQQRVGVWSLYRLERPRPKNFTFDLFLDRTLKIAMHETGHMFSLRHCTKYECLMSGTNGTFETDRRPLDNCPECMAKVVWATGDDAAKRYRRLAELWKKAGRRSESERFLEMEKAVSAVRP